MLLSILHNNIPSSTETKMKAICIHSFLSTIQTEKKSTKAITNSHGEDEKDKQEKQKKTFKFKEP